MVCMFLLERTIGSFINPSRGLVMEMLALPTKELKKFWFLGYCYFQHLGVIEDLLHPFKQVHHLWSLWGWWDHSWWSQSSSLWTFTCYSDFSQQLFSKYSKVDGHSWTIKADRCPDICMSNSRYCDASERGGWHEPWRWHLTRRARWRRISALT